MLSALVLAPLAVALVLVAVPRVPDRTARLVLVVVTGAELALAGVLWALADLRTPGATGVGSGFAFEQQVRWIPSVSASYHVGVDGLSMPLVGLTAGVFFAGALASWRQAERVRTWVALLLLLETACLGVFVALDLVLFFLFFDVSIVGMYFVVAGWGHGPREATALRFFLYTFLGSLVMLLGFLALFVAGGTFDIPALVADPPLVGSPVAGTLAVVAIAVGLAIKTPLVPFHTWLPPAHTDAPAVGSLVLAAVMLKMGTYGFVRVVMPVLPDAWARISLVVVVVAVVSVLWGALAALAQTDVKRMIAYTSVNHMGYVLLGLGAAGLVSSPDDVLPAQVAVSGAVTQMVSHGLVTGALFLLAGVLLDRGGTYDVNGYGGLARTAPTFAALFTVAAFASLGLPGLSGFLAEFQIFTGSLATVPVAVGVALLGVLVTAGLFLWTVSRLLLGPAGERDLSGGPDDEPGDGGVPLPTLAAVAPLLVLSLVLGLVPGPLLDVVDPAARALVDALGQG